MYVIYFILYCWFFPSLENKMIGMHACNLVRYVNGCGTVSL